MTKQNDLQTVINGVVGALNYVDTGTKHATQYEVGEFLQCSYNLFKKWKGTLSRLMGGTYDADSFWPHFENFLSECHNGSWSQMSRHKNEIANYKKTLFSSVKQLLSTKNDLDSTVRLIKRVTQVSSQDKIKGLTPFILSGILFAYDEDNFMILDNPVLKYFNIPKNGEPLSQYREIIDKSKSYSKEFRIPMWYINKCYGILSNNGKLDVKKLCGNCRSEKFKNFQYNFLSP